MVSLVVWRRERRTWQSRRLLRRHLVASRRILTSLAIDVAMVVMMLIVVIVVMVVMEVMVVMMVMMLVIMNMVMRDTK